MAERLTRLPRQFELFRDEAAPPLLVVDEFNSGGLERSSERGDRRAVRSRIPGCRLPDAERSRGSDTPDAPCQIGLSPAKQSASRANLTLVTKLACLC